MNRQEAQIVATEIDAVATSRLNQINVEFEGVAPEFDLPQVAAVETLHDTLADNGWALLDGELISRDQFDGFRAAWNAESKKLSGNVSTDNICRIEKIVGIKMSALKSLKAIFIGE